MEKEKAIEEIADILCEAKEHDCKGGNDCLCVKQAEALYNAGYRKQSEVDNLEYTLLGVMHSVDKWLDGDELKQDEVNRAATMREKTLRIIENAKSEAEGYEHNWQKLSEQYNSDCMEHYNRGREDVLREIFDEIDKIINDFQIDRRLEKYGYIVKHGEANLEQRLTELKKKYTEDR